MGQGKRCKAKSKTTGQQCRQFVVPGHEVCYYHGANRKNSGGASEGNKNAMTYGAYVNKLLDEGEKAVFQEFYQLLHEDFNLNKSSDRMSVELACLYFVKLTRAIESGNAEAMYKMNLLLRSQLKDLKVTKEKREGEAGGLQTSPAEWAANLLARYQESQRLKAQQSDAQKPAPAV